MLVSLKTPPDRMVALGRGVWQMAALKTPLMVPSATPAKGLELSPLFAVAQPVGMAVSTPEMDSVYVVLAAAAVGSSANTAAVASPMRKARFNVTRLRSTGNGTGPV
jgi:hypothetical protein